MENQEDQIQNTEEVQAEVKKEFISNINTSDKLLLTTLSFIIIIFFLFQSNEEHIDLPTIEVKVESKEIPIELEINTNLENIKNKILISY